MSLERKMYRWKGRLVKEKVYYQRLRSQQNGKISMKVQPVSEENPDNEIITEEAPVQHGTEDTKKVQESHHQEGQEKDTSHNGQDFEKQSNAREQQNEQISEDPEYSDGRRIVELKILGAQMWCVSCREALSFEYIEKELRRGFGSILTIRCHKCLLLNQVSTGKQHRGPNKNYSRFDINSKAVLGALDSGMGWTHLSKMCASMNIPCIDFKTFKKYEDEVGLSAEQVAKDSCRDAVALERKLTLESIQDIEKTL